MKYPSIIHKEKIIFLFFLSIYFSGLSLSESYGLSWDEGVHRVRGQKTLVYVCEKLGFIDEADIPNTLNNYREGIGAKYGPIFDLPAAALEELFYKDDIRKAYLMRHKLNWSVYFLGIIFFYLFIKFKFCSTKYAIIGVSIYLFHPRLFAHGFFNPKDSILQALIAISLYFITIAYYKRALRWFIFSGIIIGICISTRVVSIYIPALFIVLLLFEYIINKQNGIDNSNTQIKQIICLFSVSLLTLFLTWPILWQDTVQSFVNSLSLMSNHFWSGANYFFGEYISAKNIDWYYIPVWILITTPISFILLLLIGSFIATKNILYQRWSDETLFELFLLSGFIVPILSVIILNSTLYDGWRHLFFLYPFLVYFMVKGFYFSYNLIAEKFKVKPLLVFFSVIFIVFIEPLYSTFILHPNQQVYFNFFPGRDPMLKFEGDYWGLSHRQGLDYILKNDNNQKIKVLCDYGTWNRHLLLKNDKERLLLVPTDVPFDQLNSDNGDYYITGFRNRQNNDYIKAKSYMAPYTGEVFSIKIKEMKILGVYKL